MKLLMNNNLWRMLSVAFSVNIPVLKGIFRSTTGVHITKAKYIASWRKWSHLLHSIICFFGFAAFDVWFILLTIRKLFLQFATWMILAGDLYVGDIIKSQEVLLKKVLFCRHKALNAWISGWRVISCFYIPLDHSSPSQNSFIRQTKTINNVKTMPIV